MASSKHSIPASHYSECSHSEEQEKQYKELYSLLSQELTQSKAKQLESTLENIHSGIQNVLIRISEIIQTRDSDYETQVQRYKRGLNNEIEGIQEHMLEMIQGTMDSAEENLSNWGVTEQKKENFELLRKSLTHLRKSKLHLKKKEEPQQ